MIYPDQAPRDWSIFIDFLSTMKPRIILAYCHLPLKSILYLHQLYSTSKIPFFYCITSITQSFPCLNLEALNTGFVVDNLSLQPDHWLMLTGLESPSLVFIHLTLKCGYFAVNGLAPQLCYPPACVSLHQQVFQVSPWQIMFLILIFILILSLSFVLHTRMCIFHITY